MNNNLEFNFFAFEDLQPHKLYEILKMRSGIFVVEQNCVYLDMDDKDQEAIHLIGSIDNKIVSYSRIFEKGKMYNDYASIGRVIVHQDFRDKKLGHLLIKKSINYIQKNFDNASIKIGAQEHLKSFYNQHDFVAVGERFLEDGIWHIYMIR
jgi:ElaA protein